LPGYNVRPLEMSGAIGIQQLKKLDNILEIRRKNANYFIDKFKDHPFFEVQKEISSSSWFGFSLILSEKCPKDRSEIVKILNANNIECRPIVTGNFLKNKEVLEHFNYEVFGSVENAEYIDKNGLFVGNHHVGITSQIDYLSDILEGINI